MRILALDTATAATTAALLDTDSGLELEARDDPPAGSRPSHATAVLVLVEDVLRRSGDGWAVVDRIAVGLGPGTFTGLRIGVATAQGLARANRTPLVGISTLESLALGAAHGAAPGQVLIPVIDARRGEAFAAAWGAAEGHLTDAASLRPTVLTPGALVTEVGDRTAASGSPLAFGDGAIKFRAILESAGATVPEDGSDLHRVNALWHCRLAVTAEPLPLSEVQPEYLRIPDAELNR